MQGALLRASFCTPRASRAPRPSPRAEGHGCREDMATRRSRGVRTGGGRPGRSRVARGATSETPPSGRSSPTPGAVGGHAARRGWSRLHRMARWESTWRSSPGSSSRHVEVSPMRSRTRPSAPARPGVSPSQEGCPGGEVRSVRWRHCWSTPRRAPSSPGSGTPRRGDQDEVQGRDGHMGLQPRHRRSEPPRREARATFAACARREDRPRAEGHAGVAGSAPRGRAGIDNESTRDAFAARPEAGS